MEFQEVLGSLPSNEGFIVRQKVMLALPKSNLMVSFILAVDVDSCEDTSNILLECPLELFTAFSF